MAADQITWRWRWLDLRIAAVKDAVAREESAAAAAAQAAADVRLASPSLDWPSDTTRVIWILATQGSYGGRRRKRWGGKGPR